MDCWKLEAEDALKFEAFVNNATTMQGSPGWKSYSAGDAVCQCGTIAMLQPIGANFPTCNEKGPMSWAPITLGFINTLVFAIVIGWGLWIILALKKVGWLGLVWARGADGVGERLVANTVLISLTLSRRSSSNFSSTLSRRRCF